MPQAKVLGTIATLTAALSATATIAASGDPPTSETNNPAAMPIPMPTLGGKQFWADELFFHRWRIQRNVLSGRHRLLDENNLRHAWGSFEDCREQLEQIKRQRKLPPMHGKAVILLHGLGRTRASMVKLGKHLEEQGGYTVFNVAYPSTRCDVASHAQSLARIIENLEGIAEINFVAHSMGNLVIRRWLADQAHQEPISGGSKRQANVPLKRFVMLGPPNHGSRVAHALADNTLFQVVTGDSGQQLGRNWDKLDGTLATPPCEFGIIAGGKGDGRGFNPLLSGDNDGTISVATTRLAGASDFVVVPVLHSFLMGNDKVLHYTLRFLQKGYFLSPVKRQPVGK